jgi:hypothetical protein
LCISDFTLTCIKPSLTYSLEKKLQDYKRIAVNSGGLGSEGVAHSFFNKFSVQEADFHHIWTTDVDNNRFIKAAIGILTCRNDAGMPCRPVLVRQKVKHT